MNIILNLVGAAALAYGLLIGSMAKSAIHEIEAFIMFLIAAVLIVGGELSSKLDSLRTIKNQEQVSVYGQEKSGYINE